jgi:predicted DNA-binding transcriptional regulator AlpA
MSEPATLKPRLRFKELKVAGIADSWTQLENLINNQGFPAGIKLSPNVRSWTVEEVNHWLETRPSNRKVMPLNARGRPDRRRKQPDHPDQAA